MKKSFYLIVAAVVLGLGAALWPRLEIYEDGGTKIYEAPLYKFFKFHTLDGCEERAWEFFPDKTHDYDYFFKKVCPVPEITITTPKHCPRAKIALIEASLDLQEYLQDLWTAVKVAPQSEAMASLENFAIQPDGTDDDADYFKIVEIHREEDGTEREVTTKRLRLRHGATAAELHSVLTDDFVEMDYAENAAADYELACRVEAAGTTYSNLVDPETRELVKNTLAQHGVSASRIADYFYFVDFYNTAIDNLSLVEAPKLLADQPDYSDFDYRYKLDQVNPDFMGTNCRISAFTLLRDFLKVQRPVVTPDSNILTFDEGALENLPRAIFEASELANFRTIFGGIPTEPAPQPQVHFQKIQNYWREHGVKFALPTGISLVSVIVHDDLDGILFVGHTGVLLDALDGVIWLEKVSFDEPYQALFFKNRRQVYDYLTAKFARYESADGVAPFIMENDQLFLDGVGQ